MKLSLSKILTFFPNFNVKQITHEDFWHATAAGKVLVKQMPLHVDGYYTRCEGRDYMLINQNLQGSAWLHTAFHEFHHFLFDAPGNKKAFTFFKNGEWHDKRELKAEAFAVICLMPMPMLLELTPEEIEASSDLASLVRARITVLKEFGI